MSAGLIGPALSAFGLIQQMNAQKSAEGQANRAYGLAEKDAMQRQQVFEKYIQPILAGLSASAQSYDPTRQTELATQAYDAERLGTLNREIGEVRSPIVRRGLEGSSEEGGAVRGILANRANDRARFIANTRLGEAERGLAFRSSALQGLSSAFPTNQAGAGLASSAYQRAAGADYTGSLQGLYGQIKDNPTFKLPPWLRGRRPQVGAPPVRPGAPVSGVFDTPVK